MAPCLSRRRWHHGPNPLRLAVVLLLWVGCLAGWASAGPSALEERFLKKQAALEAKLSAAKETKKEKAAAVKAAEAAEAAIAAAASAAAPVPAETTPIDDNEEEEEEEEEEAVAVKVTAEDAGAEGGGRGGDGNSTAAAAAAAAAASDSTGAASNGTDAASGAAAAAATTTTTAAATEERFLKKQAALEAKLAKAKEAKKEKAAAAAAAAVAAEAAKAEGGDVLFSEEVRDENGTVWGTYSLPTAALLVTSSAGQQTVHPADHVLEYSIALGLPPPLRRQLSAKVCAALGEAHCGSKKKRGKRGESSAHGRSGQWRDRAVVARLPVNAGAEEGNIGQIDLLDGEEAVDAAYAFAARKGLDAVAAAAIKSALCQRDARPGVIACARDRAVVYHEEASPRAPLLEALSTDTEESRKSDSSNETSSSSSSVSPTSPSPSSPSSPSFPSLDLPEDLYIHAGEEAADVIYQLLVVKHQRPMEQYRKLADRVCSLNATTPHFRCSRTRFIEQVQSINLGGDAKTQVEVLDEEEPVDSIFRFALKYHIDAPQRHQMLQAVCGRRGDIGLPPCKRDLAIVLKGHRVAHPLPKEEGGGMDLPGQLIIWENEEVADVVYNWWMSLLGPSPSWRTQHHPAVGEEFRDALVNRICDGHLSKPSQYDPTLANSLLGPDHRTPRRTTDDDDDEEEEEEDDDDDDDESTPGGAKGGESMLGRPSPPAAERWTTSAFGVAPFCRRREAVILSIPLSDENQRSMGVFTLMTGEEPADAVFAFGARNGLRPEFRQNLLNVICDTVNDAHKVARHCKRRRAKSFDRHVQSHEGYTVTNNVTGEVTHPGNYPEKLTIWEDEEPADAVYRFGLVYGIPVWHRQRLAFMLCTSPEYGLACSRAIPAIFTLDINGEDQQHKGRVAVIEGQRPTDSLLLFMNQVSGTFKMAQVFKHPNLRRRLFHRLCGAAADAGQPLDCSVTVPRKRAVAVELTYMGMKVQLEYFFPDKGHYSPGDGKALPECIPLRPDQTALDDFAEDQVARYGYDQSMVDHKRRVWLRESLGIERERAAADTLGISSKRKPSNSSRSSGGGGGGGGGGGENGEYEEEEEEEQPLRTEAVSGCLAPTRAAVHFFCERLQPAPTNCEKDIHAALMQHLIKEEDSRWIKAGPVGVDYYQMMRCPNDARLEEVQVRMAANRIEVERLLDNVTGRVLKAARYGREGLVSFAETNASVAAANASLQAARSLLTAAAAGVTAARGALAASEYNGEAAETALEAARTVTEALRRSLLRACNDTIVKRNCSRASVLVPLSSLERGGSQQWGEALRLERAIALNGSYLSLDAAGRREADGYEAIAADAEERRRRAWRDRMEEKEVARLTALGINVTNATSDEERRLAEEEKEKEKARGGGGAGSFNDRWESLTPTGVPTRIHSMNVAAMMRRREEMTQGTASSRRAPGGRHDDFHNFDNFGRGAKAAGKSDKEYTALLDKIDENERKNRELLLGANATTNATANANASSANFTGGASGDAEEEEEEDPVEAYLKGLARDPNRLVVKETWRLCLEKQQPVGLKERSGGGGGGDGDDDGDTTMAIGGGTAMVPGGLVNANDTDGRLAHGLVVVPGVDVTEVGISVADLFGLATDEEGARMVLERGEKEREENGNGGEGGAAGGALPLVSDAEWHADAVVGCELLARNETWVCPAARDKLPGLLPRFPVEEPLAAARQLLNALATALSQVGTGLRATDATLAAAQRLIEAGRLNRAVGRASLTVARLNLNAANKTANSLGKIDNGAGGDDSMEKVKHRSWALKQAAFDLTEDKNREFYDKPCKPVFGACCARDQADGGMSIICDGG